MGIKRIVDTDFWVDNKVVDMFSPEDKLFFLYLMTNPHTTQLGVYPINRKIMAFELGYSLDSVSVLLDRFENKYGMIRYSAATSEIAIKNYLRHSIIKGGKPVADLLTKEVAKVKDKSLLGFIYSALIHDSGINETVQSLLPLLAPYSNENDNENDNDNENENDVSYHDSYDDSYHDSANDFEAFWSVYPKKKNKGNARKAFKKAIKKTSLQNLIDAVEAQKQTKDWQKDNGQFIPYPSTWLNAEGWENEVSADDVQEVLPF